MEPRRGYTTTHTIRTALLWGIMRRRMVILYRRFGFFFLDFLTLEDETDTLSRNLGKGLSFDGAWCPRIAQFSSTWRRKAENTGSEDLHGESCVRMLLFHLKHADTEFLKLPFTKAAFETSLHITVTWPRIRRHKQYSTETKACKHSSTS
jgi:hypothetical protein